MKKVISLLLAASMLTAASCNVLADTPTDSSTAAASEQKSAPMIMDINAAINYAINNSIKITIAEDSITAGKYAYMNAVKLKRAYKDKGNICSSLEDNLIVSGVALESVKNSWDQAIRNIDTTKNSLKTDVKQKFFTCISDNEKINIANTNCETAGDKYNQAQTKYAGGTISALELKSFELNLKEAENKLNAAKRTAEIDMLALKNLINYPADTALTLTGTFEGPAITLEEPSKAIQLSKTQNTYLTLSENKKLAEERWVHAQAWYFPSEYSYQIEKCTYNTAMQNCLNSENAMDTNIKSLYNTLLTLDEAIKLGQQKLDYMYELLKASSLQYDLGMITANDYIEKEQDYYNAKNAMIDSELQYWITSLQYKALYTLSDEN